MIKKIKSMSKKNKQKLRWSLIVVLALSVWYTGSTLTAGDQPEKIAASSMQPDSSDNESNSSSTQMVLFDEDGKQINLSDFGGKTVFFNVWATWCPPCKAEMPSIQNLYEEVKDENIQFVMLSTDRDFEK